MITSRQNPLVREIVGLKTRRGRQESGRILIEGLTEIGEAVRAGVLIERVISDPQRNRIQNMDTTWGDRIELMEVSGGVFEKLSFRENPDGLIAVATAPGGDLDRIPLGPNSVYMVLDRIEKPGNLGAIARTARAAGAAGLVVCGGCERFNPNAIRSSRGHLFAIPSAEASMEEILGWTESKGIGLLVADPGAADDLWTVSIEGPVGFVLGEEHGGVDPGWIGAGARPVRIPMMVAMDSLNVSVSAALLLYEALRRRGLATGANSSLLTVEDAEPND